MVELEIDKRSETASDQSSVEAELSELFLRFSTGQVSFAEFNGLYTTRIVLHCFAAWLHGLSVVEASIVAGHVLESFEFFFPDKRLTRDGPLSEFFCQLFP